ncbi:hypothetical protein [Bacillus cereus]|uniref:Uncharacterized protein n=1 Tax=Bacillus cereus 03BB108 TaxID=451709 RepID=A0AAN0SRH2_BACCE|nr:hypothetical protein [Bacillus cereus]AJI09090.1 hypothetical protein AK40_6133 [Bacillus cereus 03BB108]EDX59479.1 conserved hypothetical protein [Bacillus cereus 03BB108]QKG98696.1 hypothetical protein FOC96_00110 [Bacillus cereus]
MTKKIEVVHLDRKYFEENSHFKNMLDENNVPKQIKRPYVYVKVRVEDKDFLLPLRSNLNHPNGFHAPSSKSANAGIDYSHALILPNRSYIKNRTHLDREQYNYIRDNYETIKTGFGSYLKDYIRKEKQGVAYKIGKFKNSTLLNFNEELGLVKEQKHSNEELQKTEESKEDKKMENQKSAQKKEEIKDGSELQDQKEIQDKQKEQARRLAYMRQMGRER